MDFFLRILCCLLIVIPFRVTYGETSAENCIDGFCIGQSINSSRFDEVEWLVPKKLILSDPCTRQDCRPEVEFPGYPPEIMIALSKLTIIGTSMPPQETMITNRSLEALRNLRYDCTHPGKRVVGIYRSNPSGYVTYIGLRLFPDGLRIFRLAREFPFRNQNEFESLSQGIKSAYGDELLYYDGVTSNANYPAISHRKNGWFGVNYRSGLYDLADNVAELVLIDPETRQLLITSSDITAGEINLPLSLVYFPRQCVRALPIQ